MTASLACLCLPTTTPYLWMLLNPALGRFQDRKRGDEGLGFSSALCCFRLRLGSLCCLASLFVAASPLLVNIARPSGKDTVCCLVSKSAFKNTSKSSRWIDNYLLSCRSSFFFFKENNEFQINHGLAPASLPPLPSGRRRRQDRRGCRRRILPPPMRAP